MNNDGDIKWSITKKKEREREHAMMTAKRRIGHIFENWKADLCSKPRTRKEVLRYFYTLRDLLLDERKNLEENDLEAFGKMTFDIIEKHITELFTLDITGKNIAKQHIPATMQLSDQVALAKVAEFRTKEELLEIDFVRYFSEQPGFLTFFWQRIDKVLTIDFVLLAHFATGDTWLVAHLVNDVGLDDIPEYSGEATEPGSTDAPDSPGTEASDAPTTDFGQSPNARRRGTKPAEPGSAGNPS